MTVIVCTDDPLKLQQEYVKIQLAHGERILNHADRFYQNIMYHLGYT